MLKFISNVRNLWKIDNFYDDDIKNSKSGKNEYLKISFFPKDSSFYESMFYQSVISNKQKKEKKVNGIMWLLLGEK